MFDQFLTDPGGENRILARIWPENPLKFNLTARKENLNVNNFFLKLPNRNAHIFQNTCCMIWNLLKVLRAKNVIFAFCSACFCQFGHRKNTYLLSRKILNDFKLIFEQLLKCMLYLLKPTESAVGKNVNFTKSLWSLVRDPQYFRVRVLPSVSQEKHNLIEKKKY